MDSDTRIRIAEIARDVRHAFWDAHADLCSPGADADLDSLVKQAIVKARESQIREDAIRVQNVLWQGIKHEYVTEIAAKALLTQLETPSQEDSDGN